ncbi:hypothetical protein K7X08_014986 [Anisodus acutangulus]|uniref:Uncharacterized protein n=1 Tax=Anisodus acutangulus TaxID=402998 RepID=A0A9Q1QUG4_9SOLA|nr:hypothetical protein K7X08_014986 [Anisodus acutangulus]
MVDRFGWVQDWDDYGDLCKFLCRCEDSSNTLSSQKQKFYCRSDLTFSGSLSQVQHWQFFQQTSSFTIGVRVTKMDHRENENEVQGQEFGGDIVEDNYDMPRFMSHDCDCRCYQNLLDKKLFPEKGIIIDKVI